MLKQVGIAALLGLSVSSAKAENLFSSELESGRVSRLLDKCMSKNDSAEHSMYCVCLVDAVAFRAGISANEMIKAVDVCEAWSKTPEAPTSDRTPYTGSSYLTSVKIGLSVKQCVCLLYTSDAADD